MRNAILMFLVLAFVLPVRVQAQEGNTGAVMVITGHPDYPPIMYRSDDRIAGVGPELAEIILTRLKIPFENRFTGPWKRVQETVRHGQADLIVAIYYTDERAAYLDYSVPYCTDPVAVFASREKRFTVANRGDLVGRRGVALFGDSFGESLDRFVAEKLRMIRLYSTAEMFDHLLAGKSDYLLQGYYTVVIAAGRLGVADKIAVVKKDLAVEKFYFAFSKKSPYARLLPAFNRQIELLQQEGRIERMINDHLKSDVHGNPE